VEGLDNGSGVCVRFETRTWTAPPPASVSGINVTAPFKVIFDNAGNWHFYGWLNSDSQFTETATVGCVITGASGTVYGVSPYTVNVSSTYAKDGSKNASWDSTGQDSHIIYNWADLSGPGTSMTCGLGVGINLLEPIEDIFE